MKVIISKRKLKNAVVIGAGEYYQVRTETLGLLTYHNTCGIALFLRVDG